MHLVLTVPLRLCLSWMTTGGSTPVNVRLEPTFAPTIAEPTSVLKVELLVFWGLSKSRSGKSVVPVYREKNMPTVSLEILEKSPAGSVTAAKSSLDRTSPVLVELKPTKLWLLYT